MSHHLSARARLCGWCSISRDLCRLLTLFVVVTVNIDVLPASAGPVAAGGEPGPVFHTPPVTSEVIEDFRAPPHPYGPGNRGLKYGTEPGQEVRASADGEVVFAGPVAGSLHVTVRHADGVRTSYSFLSEVAVMVGQRVAQGDVVGTAGARFHFGARIGDSYFDPATLFGGVETTVELVPFEVPPGSVPMPESMAIRQLMDGDGGGLFDSLPSLPSPDDLGDAVDWLVDSGQHHLHYAAELNPLNPVLEMGWAVTEQVLFPPECTAADESVPPPSGERVALTVGGLGSSNSSSSVDNLDVEALGYTSEEVARFSYAGGLTPGTGQDTIDRLGLEGVPMTSYTSEDTQGDLREAAAQLAELLEATAVAQPGVDIDIYAHSMGGVVLRLALLELEQRGFPLEQLGVVATLGSPHQGANLATAVDVANRTAVGGEALGALEDVIDTGLDPQSTAIAQLSQLSPLIAELDAAGVPEEIDLTSVGARGDVTVPAPRTRVHDARNVTVPETGRSAHSEMVASDATTRELSLALADLPPGCVGAWDVFQDEAIGHGMAYAQDLGGSSLLPVP